MYLLEQLIDLLAPTNANCNKILVLKTINEHVHMSSYRSLAGRLKEKEASLSAQEPIHSEVEVVKRQLEENKVGNFHFRTSNNCNNSNSAVGNNIEGNII